MRINIKLYGHLPDLAGRHEFNLDVKEPTVKSLLEAIKASCPQRFVSAVMDSEYDPPELMVLAVIDGMPIFYGQGLNTPLKDGSEVILMPALAGGTQNKN
ncbi:MAG: MoaD/ThiS family protein [Dehalococcoidia bacterium]|nr:MoaD/ThiS family protein [Dehalococcoidia bacterium]MDZ4245484.1 MoaD/ThiS family protein [Dehalococcoidia bacterium]